MTASDEPDEPFEARWTAAWQLRRTDALAALSISHQLLARADRELYRAEHQGKDRVLS